MQAARLGAHRAVCWMQTAMGGCMYVGCDAERPKLNRELLDTNCQGCTRTQEQRGFVKLALISHGSWPMLG